METQFKNYFNSRKIDESYYKSPFLPRFFKEILPIDKNIKILDYGCGYGQTIRGLVSKGYCNVSGYDIEESAISFCKQKGINIYEKLPSHEKFDFIILSHVLEHFEKKRIIQNLIEIREMLNNDGALLVNVPNAQSNTGAYWAFEDFTHSTIFTSGSIYYVLKQAGFQNIEYIDIDGTSGLPFLKSLIIKLLLKLYRANIYFWNKVTSSSFHRPSPLIFSYDLKVLAKKN